MPSPRATPVIFPRIAAAVALTILGGVTCTEGSNWAPLPDPPPPPGFAPTEVVSGVVPAGGSLTYTFALPPIFPVRFFLQGTSGNANDSLVAIVRTEIGTFELGRVVTDGAAPTPHTNGVAISAAPIAMRVLIEVRGVRPTDAGSFTLSALEASGGPELNDTLLPLGVLISETLESSADHDFFRVQVDSGQRVLVFIGKYGWTAPTVLRATITSQYGPGQGSVSEFRGNHEVFERSLLFEPDSASWFGISMDVPPVGPHTPWVSAGFQLLALAVSRAPENAPPQLVRGDTTLDGFDEIGDIDEFELETGPSEDFQVAFALEHDVQVPIHFRLMKGGAILDSFSLTTASADLLEHRTPIIRSDQAGLYRIHVSGPTQAVRAGNLTPYRLVVVAHDRAPENASVTVELGVPVAGESIDGTDDIDEFEIELEAGQRFATQLTGNVTLNLVGPAGVNYGSIVSEGLLPFGYRGSVSALTAPGSARYTLRVRGRTPGVHPYTFTISLVDTLPETVAAELPLNTWVTGESLDYPGDVDRFRFTMPSPGGILNVIVENETIAGGVVGHQQGIGSFDLSNWTGIEGSSGLYRIASGEAVWLQLGGTTWNADTSGPGTYRIMAAVIDTAPEIVSAILAVGDTVTDEVIQPVGDWDDYALIGTPGQAVVIHFPMPPRPPECPSTAPFRIETYDGETRLTEGFSGIPSAGITNVSIPTSGTLRIVIRSTLPYRALCYTGPYTFSVNAAP